MKPIFSTLSKDEFKETIQKLESPEALRTMEQLFQDFQTKPQQQILSDLVNFGLRNISGFTRIRI